MPRTMRSGRRGQGGTGDEASEDVVPARWLEQEARAVRPAWRAGPGRSTANRGGAHGRGPAGDPRAAGGGGGAAAHECGRASRGRGRASEQGRVGRRRGGGLGMTSI